MADVTADYSFVPESLTINLFFMKSKILILIALVLLSAASRAQLGGLLNKVKNKVNQRANQKVDGEIDKVLDKAEGKQTDNAGAGSTDNQKVSAPTLKSFSKYDFIPGEKIVYYENFESEALGELPQGWNTSNSGEVVTLDNSAGKWLRLHKQGAYLSANQQVFDENFTMELDLLLQLKNNGWIYPDFSVGFLSTGEDNPSANEYLKSFTKNTAVLATIFPGEYNSSKILVESSNQEKTYFKSEPKAFGILEKYYGSPVHIAIQVQKERFRMWVNETKIFDVPKAVPVGDKINQLFFKVGTTNYAEEQYGVFISNVKVGQGLPDTRHKLIETGNFTTSAILFDVNAATIKPESAGVLKEIAGVFKQYPDLKVKIVGHTDSDGKEADNLALSQKRAAAVKEYLVSEFGIEADKIETEGKGETIPVADNKTKEGKAQNRRVEFVKL